MKKIRAILDDYLDPTEQLAHLLVGVIMVLIIGFVTRGECRDAAQRGEEARAEGDAPDPDDDPVKIINQGLWNALGCNIAWGLITGIMYSMSTIHMRSRAIRLQSQVRADDADQAIADLREELDDELAVITTAEEREQLYRKIAARLAHTEMSRASFRWEDLVAGIIIFALVVLPFLPAWMPFWFLDDKRQALRVSDRVMVGLLFVIGWCWGRVVHWNPWLTGPAIMILGLGMVIVGELLGG